MPPDSVVQHLVDTYFVHVHNQPYAYFQEEHFRQLLNSMLLPRVGRTMRWKDTRDRRGYAY
ncbi:hypothetical protein NW764_016461 [Fusarium oxysporum]|nr:hypothetical protein NW764_016461 [Fusarium oxysporum]